VIKRGEITAAKTEVHTDQNDFHACCGHEILSDLGEEKEPSPFRDRAIDIGFKAVGYLPGALYALRSSRAFCRTCPTSFLAERSPAVVNFGSTRPSAAATSP
jgi:hypothetical protein